MPRNEILFENIRLLQQGIDLLQGLDDHLFCDTDGHHFDSAVGKHLRHCLDHYANFLAGLETGLIDYDSRRREPRLETDRRYAIAALRELNHRLEALAAAPLDRPITVAMYEGAGDGAPIANQSTVARELQFLLSHTVHHYALIALMLRLLGHHPAQEGLGVAPSTLRYLRSRQACAQ